MAKPDQPPSDLEARLESLGWDSSVRPVDEMFRVGAGTHRG